MPTRSRLLLLRGQALTVVAAIVGAAACTGELGDSGSGSGRSGTRGTGAGGATGSGTGGEAGGGSGATGVGGSGAGGS
ncbi:MAG TPA: hypothetical protein VK540_35475, partial [Polyangiaceae bacterium]|nr:hypothetical protein [Polyangiaceae bacterium]